MGAFMRASLMVITVLYALLFLFVPQTATSLPSTPPLVPETSGIAEAADSVSIINSASVNPETIQPAKPVPQTIASKHNNASESTPESAPQTAPDFPRVLAIPSIKLNAPIVSVGINEKGEMDVPPGYSNAVGWYQYGTSPGEVGSAVIDAHVYAAFNNLRYVKVGSEIDVATANGKTLRFKVEDSRVYKLGEIPLDYLFSRTDAKRLNLITCAGKFIPSLNTYDHRLVVYATLVEE
jgi:LPXTG-site transpeptidase (sortase) family protein